MNDSSLDVAPATGWSDPLAVYFHAFAGFIGGRLRGTKDLSAQPEMIELQLNEWVRFDQPGRYRVTSDSSRVFTGGFGTPGPPIRVKSNPIDRVGADALCFAAFAVEQCSEPITG